MDYALQFDPRSRRFLVTPDHRRLITEAIERDLASGNHTMMAQEMIGPIRQVAVYYSWTDDLFNHRQVGFNDRPRVALQSYTAQAWVSSPDGVALYTRPGRSYVVPEATRIMAGVKVGWDDLRAAGWDLMEMHIQQAGEELARKRDELAKQVLDAFFAANPARTVGAASLTRAAVDLVIKNAITDKFPVSRVIVNPARILDMATWTNVTSTMWSNLPERYGEQIVRQGYITEYGGLTWITRDYCPADEVFFVGDPAANGMFHFIFGEGQANTDEDIHHGVTYTVWRETHGYMIAGGMALWRILIS